MVKRKYKYRIAAALAAAFALAPLAPAAAVDEPTVTVVGDSLEWNEEATPYYATALTNAGWAPYLSRCWVDSTVWSVCGGQQIPWGVEQVTLLPEPDAWVIALGTNDAAVNDFGDAQWRTRIKTMLAALGPDAPILWVNVIFKPPQSIERITEGNQFNRILKQVVTNYAANGWPIKVGYWKWYVEDNEPFPWLDNGLHYAPAGYELRANWMTKKIGGWK